MRWIRALFGRRSSAGKETTVLQPGATPPSSSRIQQLVGGLTGMIRQLVNNIGTWLNYNHGWSKLTGWALFLGFIAGVVFWFPGPQIQDELNKKVVILNADPQRAFARDQMVEEGLRYPENSLLPLKYTWYPHNQEAWVDARITGPGRVEIAGDLQFRITYPQDVLNSIQDGTVLDYYDSALCRPGGDSNYDSAMDIQYRWISCEGGYVVLTTDQVLYLQVWYQTSDPVHPISNGASNAVPAPRFIIGYERLNQRALGEPATKP